MSNTTTVAPTLLGDALRRLAEILDGAPSIQGAARSAAKHNLSIELRTPVAVQKIAEDLAFPTYVYGERSEYTAVDVVVGPVRAHVWAHGDPIRVLHRPVDVTAVIEGTAA